MIFSKKKKIQNKQIGEIQNYQKYTDVIKNTKKNNLFNIFLIIICVVFVGYTAKYFFAGAKYVFNEAVKGTVSIVSTNIGKEMQKDELGNINFLIVGFGGGGHAGGYLADSTIVASRNPELGSISMLSVPRDLFVVDTQHNNALGRINEVFARSVGRSKEVDTGAKMYAKKLEEMMGITIPYYVLVDFQGFEELIDSIGGVNVFVEKTIHDTTYPDGNMGYMTFHVDSGRNTFNGQRALMYARSRHSTSDFSRSLRQQEIIKAIVEKVKDQGFGVNKLKNLYNQYTKIVTTNIEMDEIIGVTKHLYDLKNIFSFGLSTDCSNVNYQKSYPGCFLYVPERDLFGGAAVILPYGATPTSVSTYDYIKNFAFFVMHNQGYLIEKANITIHNSIDKSYAKSLKMKQEGYANKIAVKLNKYGFKVTNIDNAPTTGSQTIAYIYGTGEYQETINMMKYFIPISKVVYTNKEQQEPGILIPQVDTGVDLLVVLGNNYVDYIAGKPFNYYK